MEHVVDSCREGMGWLTPKIGTTRIWSSCRTTTESLHIRICPFLSGPLRGTFLVTAVKRGRRMDGSHEETESLDERDRMVEAWKRYGGRYNVFVPDDQPTPKGDAWHKLLPEPTDQGAVDPQFLKHWRVFHYTRAFLRERYAEYGILQGPSLTFDCLVPKFLSPLAIPTEKRAKYGLPKNADPRSWYEGSLRMTITSHGEVGFTCQSRECLRTKCKLNLHNAKRISPADIFSLIQIFHGYRSVAKAKNIIQERFHVQMGKFESKGIEEKSRTCRYAVPKWEIHALIGRFANMRRQHIPKLVQESEELIRSCEIVELDHSRIFSNYFAFLQPQIINREILRTINSPAIRLYLWLLVEQEQRARRNEFAVRLSDASMARALGVSRKTVGIYRQNLEKLGLVKVKGLTWNAGYTVNFQRNT
jgi:DNA-binding CsgD family transcriptional regulator